MSKKTKLSKGASTVTADARAPLPVVTLPKGASLGKGKNAASAGKAAKNPKDPKNLRAKAALLAIDQIKTRFGEGSIMKLGDAKRVDVGAISTGSLSLDIALGVGGVPKGRIIEIYGPESSGKTTLAQHIVANVQKQGGIAAFVDAEHALDPEYAKRIGVKIDDLLISQPDTGEQALEIVETLVSSNAVDVVVVDSVAALTPRAEIEGEMGQSHMGLQARLMSQALRKLTGTVSKSNTTVVFINQTRMKIGVLFGNPETTTGGMALKFYSSVRIEIRRRAQLKMGDDIIGNRAKVKIVKNKVAAPFRSAEFDIMYNKGISFEGDVLDTGVLYGVIVKSGTWFTYEDTKLGQGREAAKKFLAENPKITKGIEKHIWAVVRERERTGQSIGVSAIKGD
jgi:recombination protein RecA